MDSEALGIQTLQHIMHMARSWDSVMSMIPKGGEVIWGGMDWSPEDGFECHTPKQSGGSNVRKRVLDMFHSYVGGFFKRPSNI